MAHAMRAALVMAARLELRLPVRGACTLEQAGRARERLESRQNTVQVLLAP